MKSHSRFLLTVLGGVLSFSLVENLAAQQVTEKSIRIKRVKGVETDAPRYQGRGHNLGTSFSQSSDKKWHHVFVQYDTAPDWIDELDIEVYALIDIKKPTRTEKYRMLKGTFSYVNIEKGSHLMSTYIHPSMIERYGEPDRIVVIFKNKGRTLLTEGNSSAALRGQWWTKLTPLDGYILNRLNTPFRLIDSDNYEMQKPGNRR